MKYIPVTPETHGHVVGGEIIKKPELKILRGGKEDENAAKEKAAELAREKLYTEVDIALRRLQIEASGNNAGLSEPEARALVAKMQEAVAGFTFYDGVFLDQMQAIGEPLFDTKRSVKLKTAVGNEAVFKVMLKTDTGEFKLQGDVLDPKGQYAEKLMG